MEYSFYCKINFYKIFTKASSRVFEDAFLLNYIMRVEFKRIYQSYIFIANSKTTKHSILHNINYSAKNII